MEMTKEAKSLEQRFASYDEATASEADKQAYASYQKSLENGMAYRSAKFEFGAQLKADVKVNINDNFFQILESCRIYSYCHNYLLLR